MLTVVCMKCQCALQMALIDKIISSVPCVQCGHPAFDIKPVGNVLISVYKRSSSDTVTQGMLSTKVFRPPFSVFGLPVLQKRSMRYYARGSPQIIIKLGC